MQTKLILIYYIDVNFCHCQFTKGIDNDFLYFPGKMCINRGVVCTAW